MEQVPAIVLFCSIIATLWAFLYRLYDFRVHFILAIADLVLFLLTFVSCYYMPVATVCNVTTVNNVTIQYCKAQYSFNPHVVWSIFLIILGLVHLFWALYLKISGLVESMAIVVLE